MNTTAPTTTTTTTAPTTSTTTTTPTTTTTTTAPTTTTTTTTTETTSTSTLTTRTSTTTATIIFLTTSITAAVTSKTLTQPSATSFDLSKGGTVRGSTSILGIASKPTLMTTSTTALITRTIIAELGVSVQSSAGISEQDKSVNSQPGSPLQTRGSSLINPKDAPGMSAAKLIGLMVIYSTDVLYQWIDNLFPIATGNKTLREDFSEAKADVDFVRQIQENHQGQDDVMLVTGIPFGLRKGDTPVISRLHSRKPNNRKTRRERSLISNDLKPMHDQIGDLAFNNYRMYADAGRTLSTGNSYRDEHTRTEDVCKELEVVKSACEKDSLVLGTSVAHFENGRLHSCRLLWSCIFNELRYDASAHKESFSQDNEPLDASKPPQPSPEVSLWDDIRAYGNAVVEALNGLR
ncbi:unnamed protein product [Cylicocyclus nassatus]|uniref:Uncharacterized protein n=1 Tax=Cylicocyclus nassatus TaxID=53992 RepID=A0AA36GVR0_CYLNA|nr:unnamed protein product [Cylicocyclus nassatus]